MHVNFFKYLRKLNKFSIVGKPRPNWIFHGKIFWKKEELKLKKMIINFCAFSVKSCKLRILITKTLILSVRWPWGVTFPSASFYLPSAFFTSIQHIFTSLQQLFTSLQHLFTTLQHSFYFPSPFFTSLHHFFTSLYQFFIFLH